MRHADEDEKGRQQKAAADAEDAREEPHHRAQPKQEEDVERDGGDREINIHRTGIFFLAAPAPLASTPGTLQPPRKAGKADLVAGTKLHSSRASFDRLRMSTVLCGSWQKPYPLFLILRVSKDAR